MAETDETLIVDYDADSDVLRVFVETPTADAVAVPTSGAITVLVSESLDRTIGVVFEHFVGMLKKTRTMWATEAERQKIFEESRETIISLIPAMLPSMGLQAKDSAARWHELISGR